MFSVNKKVVIVTGAAGGIGLGLVKSFSKANANVVAVDKSKNVKRLKSASKDGLDNLLTIQADLRVEDELLAIIKQTISKFKRIDVLVNCAGVNIRKKLEAYTNEE